MLLFPDRFWWLQRVVGILLVVGCFIAAIYTAIQAYNTYNTSQIPGGDPIDTALLRNLATQFLLLAGIFALFVGQGILLILKSVDAQRRFRRRVRAIKGEQDAMARASVKVDTRSAPVLSGESLELLWRATSLNSGIMTTIFTISLVICGSFTGIFLYLAYCLATNTPPIGSTHLEPIAPLERVGVVAIVGVVAAMLLLLIVFVIRWLPWERGKPYGVMASDDGLWYYPRGGKKRFLRWEDVRLLEVSISKRQRRREYKLYGRKTIAEWRELPPSALVTLGLTQQVFWERHQALLNLIVARTHLLPRTFDKRLAEADEGFSISRRRYG